MQVVRKAVAPFCQYYSYVQKTLHPERTFQQNVTSFTLLVRNNTKLASTSVGQRTNLETILETGSGFGLSPADVSDAIAKSPELSKASPSQWENCFSLLVGYGFSCKDCLGMVKAHPELLVTDRDKVMKTLGHWRSSNLGDKNLLSVLKYNPYFLCVDGKQIEKRLPLLQSLTSPKRLSILLKNSPDLMFQNWKEVQRKVAYLKDVMKVEEVEIVKTAALSLASFDLMARHAFLERSGGFTPVKPTALPGDVNTNPRLSQITDTSDETFATAVAGLTLEEFEVFREVFAAEQQESDLSDSDEEE